jgi:hypothetical protein
MIADLIPLLAFATFLVIARNVFEAHILDHERRQIEARERVHLKDQTGTRVRHTHG